MKTLHVDKVAWAESARAGAPSMRWPQQRRPAHVMCSFCELGSRTTSTYGGTMRGYPPTWRLRMLAGAGLPAGISDLSAPILLGLALHRRRRRILHLEPGGRPSGDHSASRAASTRYPRAP